MHWRAVSLLSGLFGIIGFSLVPWLVFATGISLLNAVVTPLFSVGAFGTTTALTCALAGLLNP